MNESIWLVGILLISAGIEYFIIVVFDLHPVFSVKIQGLIGLLIIGYIIRMTARLWNLNRSPEIDND
ncbi:hypothetical protein NC796_13660 [Aliifodinibius sp. S!AR15-10]|nr:hypothetical protein [Aliifodinibius sp. S!AR15-10]